MAGFDSTDEAATTNFFFYLGRMCEKLGIFCALIGHVPKGANVPQSNPWGTAASRLRGVAIWTTAPRMVVEVRSIQEWSKVDENPRLRAMLPGVKARDILVIYVAKTNLEGVCREPRYLVRTEQGAFKNVEAPEQDTALAEAADAGKPRARKRRATSSKSKTSLSKTERDEAKKAKHRPATPLVLRAIKVAYPNIAHGDYVIESRIKATLENMRREEPLEGYRLIVSSSGSGESIRVGGLSWHLQQLVEAGVLLRHNGRYHFAAWPDPSQDMT